MARFENYDSKMQYLIHHQGYKCAGCGKPVSMYKDYGRQAYYDNYTGEKLDFAHYYPRWDKNRKRCPLYIDSLWNGSVMHNHCNVARKLPLDRKGRRLMRTTYYIADKREAFLKRHPMWADFVRGFGYLRLKELRYDNERLPGEDSKIHKLKRKYSERKSR